MRSPGIRARFGAAAGSDMLPASTSATSFARRSRTSPAIDCTHSPISDAGASGAHLSSASANSRARLGHRCRRVAREPAHDDVVDSGGEPGTSLLGGDDLAAR